MQNTNECVSISLFDYLGRPAGSKLGLEVAAAAKKADEPVLVRKVQTKTYTGLINVYRRSFLEAYFNKSTTATTTVKQTNLPF